MWHLNDGTWYWIDSKSIIVYSNSSDPLDWSASPAWSEPQTEPPVTQEQCHVAERVTRELVERLRRGS